MNEIVVKPIKVDSVDKAIQESHDAFESVNIIAIKDQATYENVAEIRQVVNSKIKELNKERKTITDPLNVAKNKIIALFKKPITMCEEVISVCDSKLVEWTDKQEKLRKEQQEKLDRQAEKEREKREEEERKWQEKEDANRAEADRLLKEGREEEARKANAEAEKAAAKVEEKQVKAAEIIAPVIAPKVEKVKGVHFTEKFSGEVTDFSILSDDYKIVDQSKLNKVIQATKGTLAIPGVKIKVEKIVNTRKVG